MSRDNRPNATSTQPAGTSSPGVSSANSSARGKGKMSNFNLFGWGTVALLFSITILIVAVAFSIFFGGPASEFKNVDKSKYQAVFLNGGQVYFGKINNLNAQFMGVSDIYYLRVNQQVQPDQQQTKTAANDISLVKLGCELHGPSDSMVINREQVIFWENLKDEGQVAKAVADYKKQNPEGQKCDAPANAATPPAATPPAATPPAATPPAATPRR